MEYAQGTTYIYKLNASNGEIVWEKSYTDVAYDKAVSGGALSSPLLGKKGTAMEGMVIFHIARTPSYSSGTLVALNTQTGEVVWEKAMDNYAWSTPTAVYTEDNQGYIIICDSAGRVHMLNGTTGESVAVTSVGSNVEASPIVYKNMIVVGTRGQKVYGIKIS
jgi:outer membrane protein assembly factor BamB